MNCEQARQAWHDARDDGVTDAAVNDHLAGCRECRAYFSELTAIDGLLDQLRTDSESVLSERDSAGSARPARVLRIRGAWLAAAVVAAAVGLGWVVAHLVGGGGQRLVERVPPAGHLDDGPAVPPDAGPVPGERPPPGDATRVVLVGETSDRYLAIEAKTSRPGVKVYWLYPTVSDAVANGAS